jgi:(E)-4-hydroxy-3-methyl-but-2-enyl pyrophosphate reductase
MKVLRAEYLGFCRGVKDAISLAEKTTRRAGRVYSFGPLIHNKQTVDRLREIGLKVVDSLDELGSGPILIRAHGVDPATKATIQARSPDIVDATCVLVQRAQRVVSELHQEGYAVVVIGDAHHPEVEGIVGYAPDVVVVARPDELDRLPHRARLGVVGQTTLSQETFAAMVGQIVARSFREIKVVNTLCKEVYRRLAAAVDLCSQVDVMFVLGGLHSSNTRQLAHVCRERGAPTYHLEDWSAFRAEYVRGCRVAGVTAGASTPDWVINEFVENLERFEVEALNDGTHQPCCSSGLPG